MGNKIKELRKKKGLTQEALASKINCTTSQVIKLERGERRLSDVWLDRLAPALDATRAEILGEKATFQDHLNRRYKVIGKVNAGVFTNETDVPVSEQEAIVLPTGSHPWANEFYVLEVCGDSMDKLGIVDGSYIACLDIKQYVTKLESGDLVVARRSDNNGRHETVLMQVEIQADGNYWIYPRSSNPEFQQPFKIRPPHESDSSLSHTEVGEFGVLAVVMTWLPAVKTL